MFLSIGSKVDRFFKKFPDALWSSGAPGSFLFFGDSFCSRSAIEPAVLAFRYALGAGNAHKWKNYAASILLFDQIPDIMLCKKR